MTELVEKIVTKKFDEANGMIKEMFKTILANKLLEVKKVISAKKLNEGSAAATMLYRKMVRDNLEKERAEQKERHKREMEKKESEKDLKEEELDEAARVKIVKARVRNGKIQRRRKIATLPGYTMRQGKLTRMSVTERRKRKMGQRRGKIKRKAKMSRAIMKRKRSMRKREAIGLR